MFILLNIKSAVVSVFPKFITTKYKNTARSIAASFYPNQVKKFSRASHTAIALSSIKKDGTVPLVNGQYLPYFFSCELGADTCTVV
jgi:hypothetical protein